MAGGVKRDYNGKDVTQSRFAPMFERLRDELDEHHDRKERIVKASRDVTAESKKMYVCRFSSRQFDMSLTGPKWRIDRSEADEPIESSLYKGTNPLPPNTRNQKARGSWSPNYLVRG